MNIRVLICGVLGGLLSAYLLSYPLYLVLPRQYTEQWLYDGPEALGYVGYAFAAIVGLVTGYAAARWSWATTAGAAARSGAVAGLLAALVAFPLIVAPAAAVASQQPIWAHGAKPAADEREANAIVCECVVRASWYPYLAFWATLAAGLVLGTLGGWFSSMRRSAPWGDNPPSVADEAGDTSLALMVQAVWVLVIIVQAIPPLQANVQNSVEKYNLDLSWSARGIQGWPMANTFALLAVTSWFSGRWCMRRSSHSVPGVRRAARLAQMLVGFLPLATVLTIMNLRLDLFEDEVFTVGLAVWVLVLVYWAARSSRTTPGLSVTEPPAATSFRDRMLLNGGLLGSLIPGLGMALGVSQAVALGGGIVRYLVPLYRFKGPVDSSGPLAPAAAIQDLYAFHFYTSMNLAATWIVVATLHAAFVRWWRGRHDAGMKESAAVA